MKNIFGKKRRWLSLSKPLVALLCAVLFFGVSGCANELNDERTSGTNENARTLVSVSNDNKCVVTLYLYGVPDTVSTPGIWAWNKNGNYVSDAWGDYAGSTKMTATTKDSVACYTFELTVDKTLPFGLLFRDLGTIKDGKGTGGSQTGNAGGKNVEFGIDAPNKDKLDLYFKWGDPLISYTSYDDFKTKNKGVSSALLTDCNLSEKTTSITLTTLFVDSLNTTDLTVANSAKTSLEVKSAEKVTTKENTYTVVVSANDVSALLKTPYTLTYSSNSITATETSGFVDSLYSTDEAAAKLTDLGLTIETDKTTFKTWSPTAKSVELLLYSSSTTAGVTPSTYENTGATTKDLGTVGKSVVMTKNDTTGTWSAELSSSNYQGYTYYKYKITMYDGTIYYVSDIWHTVAGPDSIASQIATINDSDAIPEGLSETYDGTTSAYKNPFGNTGAEIKKYNDAVIYEMHIRDWSRAVVPNSTGKFLDIANSDEIMNHLKDLGVTHVQILPMFDYAQSVVNKNYNWGYNPYHYNVPEGRYVKDGYTDGTQAVKEMRTMIQKFHDNGIAVIMDVVYNHTNGTKEGSLYDSTVPKYFYRQTASGDYSNGTGCGNETASERAMVKKYFLDSLKHWVLDYHINGFRFDLMGVHDTTFMKAVYDELYAIDKNILVYGEPWTGGTIALDSEYTSATAAETATTGYGYGAFDDDFRDAVKGAEYGGLYFGQVQGDFSDKYLNLGLVGSTITKNNRNKTDNTGLALHYAECHDNYTLFDKLVYSTDSTLKSKENFASKFLGLYKSVMNDSSKLDLIKKEDKLAAAYVILSQGTPFINGGQEFLRTKRGNPDSYAADKKGGITWTNAAGSYNIDDVNTINLSYKQKYSDVYKTYRGLIHLRRDFDAFTSPSETATAEILKNDGTEISGFTKYVAKGTKGNFTVLFNATSSEQTLAETDQVKGYVVTIEGSDFTVSSPFISAVYSTVTEIDSKPYTIATEENTTKSVPAKSFVIVKTK